MVTNRPPENGSPGARGNVNRSLTLAEVTPVLQEEELIQLIQNRRDLESVRMGLANRLAQANPTLLQQFGNPEALSRALQALAESNRERLDLLSRKESFFKKVLKAPFRAAWATIKFAGRHPILTTAALAALALWGVPALMEGTGAIEGLLAQVPVNRIVEHMRSFLRLSGTVPVSPIPETIPPDFI